MSDQIDQADIIAILPENFIGPPIQEIKPSLEKPLRRSLKKGAITTIDLTSSTCRWPLGDPVEQDFHYCGQVSQADRPYCDKHDAMSRPVSQRKIRTQAG